MADLRAFDVNAAADPNNNIFGLPFSEEDASLIIVPIPWEVTVSYGKGTARSAEHIFRASMQVDLYEPDYPDAWQKGFYMEPINPKILLKSDFLRKEAELYINFMCKEEDLSDNKFICKSLKDINEGGAFLTNWVYEHTLNLLKKGKKVGILGGDHSTPLGYWKAVGEHYGSFGILQIDAHCDLREAYEGLTYSHASITYNGLKDIPQIEKIVQVGIRDYSKSEWEYICNSNFKVVAFRDREMKDRLYNGDTWNAICEDIIAQLPQLVYVSFDIDGLDPKLCPNTGTPVHGGMEAEQVNYLLRKIVQSGRKLIGFDLVEVGLSENNWDANVAARELWQLCNLMVIN